MGARSLMGARSAKTARDAKLAMKGLSETGTYRFPQLKLSSTLFSDNRKERGVKMRWELRRSGNRELQEAQNRGESQQEVRKLQWNQCVRQNSVGTLLGTLELLEAQCDIEQENARACEAEELQNLQRTESARELQSFRTSL